MKKFKVLKNFIHDGKIWNAGEEFTTRSRSLAESLEEQGLVEEMEDDSPARAPQRQQQQQQQPPAGTQGATPPQGSAPPQGQAS